MRLRWKIFIILDTLITLPLLYLLVWPVPIDPVAWTPFPAPELTGHLATNQYLVDVVRLPFGDGYGAEDVAIDSQGRVYGGLEDGRIVRFPAEGGEPEVLADTGGRPLGLHFDAAENLIVADAKKGLLSVAPDGSITVLSTEEGGIPYRFTDDVDIGADGVIYFSDASSRFSIEHYVLDLLEHGLTGRLLAYDPRTKTVTKLLDGLQFANGVAVSPDQSFVLVIETGKYRVRRYWLTGPKQGGDDILIENLPGFPDGVSSNGRGIFWVAIASPRNPMVDWALPRPFMRTVMARLPRALQPAPQRHGIVLGISAEGQIVHNLQDPQGGYTPITSVEERNGLLYFGSLEERAIGRIAVPAAE